MLAPAGIHVNGGGLAIGDVLLLRPNRRLPRAAAAGFQGAGVAALVLPLRAGRPCRRRCSGAQRGDRRPTHGVRGVGRPHRDRLLPMRRGFLPVRPRLPEPPLLPAGLPGRRLPVPTACRRPALSAQPGWPRTPLPSPAGLPRPPSDAWTSSPTLAEERYARRQRSAYVALVAVEEGQGWSPDQRQARLQPRRATVRRMWEPRDQRVADLPLPTGGSPRTGRVTTCGPCLTAISGCRDRQRHVTA
jgi:hypothetical protein